MSGNKIVVLGAGMVGSAIARDLAKGGEFQVHVVDLSQGALDALAGEAGITVAQADLSDASQVAQAVAGHDLAVGAVPGFMGYATVQTCLEQGRDVVDISFFPEDALELDALAREKGAVCLVDFGIAPGCSNLFFGHAAATFGRVDRYACYVGGLPIERSLPWEYQAPFSPVDVLEEYTRPARYIHAGKVVTTQALAQTELLEFRGVGTLEAFLTDGLRSLLKAEGADKVKYMVEKTCRYPGYRDKVALLRDTGFLSEEPVALPGGAAASPMQLTTSLLLDAWRQGPDDEDLTAMKISAEGVDGEGKPIKRAWDLLDRYDRETRTSSMARTTGYSCTAGVRMVIGGLWSKQGVCPPEVVGRNIACFDFVLAELAKRGVVFQVVE